jgi:hypothetical protein
LSGLTHDYDGSDQFGYALALSGDTLAVGAPSQYGVVHVFTRKDGIWKRTGLLRASNAGRGDGFGSALAISGDTIVVGAPGEDSLRSDGYDNHAQNSGAVYIFTRSNEDWKQTAFLKHPNSNTYKYLIEDDKFGSSVALWGNTIAIGAPGDYAHPARRGLLNGIGTVHMFLKSNGSWVHEAQISSPQDTYIASSIGRHIALSENVLVVGSPGYKTNEDGSNEDRTILGPGGLAQIFTRQNGIWDLTSYLQSSNPEFGDGFGNSPTISGSTIAVGARNEDSSASGGQSDNSERNAGAVYVFE